MVELAPTGPDSEYRMGFAGDPLNKAWYLRQLFRPDDQVVFYRPEHRPAVRSDEGLFRAGGYREQPHREIARSLGCHVRTVERAKRELVTAGFI